MVVLAASIVSKNGKAIVSRQFRDIQRSRIEGLLASFPKLVSTGQQHTTVETEHVRYVYQPMEDLYMVLITNRQSNILQDIESLKLFAAVVADTCRTCDEHNVLDKAFEILFAFDEIISEGYRENVNLSQVKSILEMESHEEKIQEIITRNKMDDARQESKKRAQMLEEKRRQEERARQGLQNNFGGSSFGNGGRYSPLPDSPARTMETYSFENRSQTPPIATTTTKVKGMKLGSKGKSMGLYDAIEPNAAPLPMPQAQPVQPVLPTPTVVSTPAVHRENVHVIVDETISMSANHEGVLKKMDVKGILVLKILDKAQSRVRLNIRVDDDDAAIQVDDQGSIKFKTHPNVNKDVFKNENAVQMKDTSRGFPVNQDLELARWTFTSNDETLVPLSINYWPSLAGDGTCDVNIEYELRAENMELHDVVISLPLPAGFDVNVISVDGDYTVDRNRRQLLWQIPIIDSSNSSGQLECNIPGNDTNQLFPVNVNFVSEKGLFGIEVVDAIDLESDSPIKFSKDVAVTTKDYTIG